MVGVEVRIDDLGDTRDVCDRRREIRSSTMSSAERSRRSTLPRSSMADSSRATPFHRGRGDDVVDLETVAHHRRPYPTVWLAVRWVPIQKLGRQSAIGSFEIDTEERRVANEEVETGCWQRRQLRRRARSRSCAHRRG